MCTQHPHVYSNACSPLLLCLLCFHALIVRCDHHQFLSFTRFCRRNKFETKTPFELPWRHIYLPINCKTRYRLRKELFCFTMENRGKNDDVSSGFLVDSDSDNSEVYSLEFDEIWSDSNNTNFHLDCTDCATVSGQVHIKFFDGDANQALNLFRVARVYVSHIPHEIFRHRRIRGMSNVFRATLLKLLDAAVKRLSLVLFTCDGCGLYSAYCSMK